MWGRKTKDYHEPEMENDYVASDLNLRLPKLKTALHKNAILHKKGLEGL